MPSSARAPKFTIPNRQIFAIEHPMIIKNIDNGLKTFGCAGPSKQILNSRDIENCIPLYLRPADRTCAPILSHNAPCTNVLLKITVPKRTGRKRKRGSQDPYVDDSNGEVSAPFGSDLPNGESPELRSHSRLDNPRKILRVLKDNIGKYIIEPAGSVETTHRYRGLADFHQSTTHQNFMTKFRDTILTSKLEKIKEFRLNPSKGPVQNEEIVPPPSFTDKIIPFNWGYHQNPTIKLVTDPASGEIALVNMSASNRLLTQYIRHDIETVPSAPPLPPPDDPIMTGLLIELQKALEERPIWTRRALQNRISDVPGMYLMKPAIQYIGYQFRGGPWRDSIIKWGVDPRKDPKYRIFQTLFFKIYNRPDERQPGDPWHDVRSEYTRTANRNTLSRESHIFDGTSISLDGKVWQVCDITDPLIKFIASTEILRETCNIETDGWFCNGTWAKIKGIMKTKIAGIRVGRQIRDEEFASALDFPDVVELTSTRKKLTVPLPDWRLNADDVNEMKKRGIKTSITDSGLRKRRVKGRAFKKFINGKRAEKPMWRRGPRRKIRAKDASSEKAGREEAEAFPVDPRLIGATESLGGTIHPEEIDKDLVSDDEVDTSMDETDESEDEEDDDGISDIVDEDADADISDEDEDDEDEGEEHEGDEHEVDEHEVDEHEVDDHEVDEHEVDDHEVDEQEVDEHEDDEHEGGEGEGDEHDEDENEYPSMDEVDYIY